MPNPHWHHEPDPGPIQKHTLTITHPHLPLICVIIAKSDGTEAVVNAPMGSADGFSPYVYPTVEAAKEAVEVALLQLANCIYKFVGE